MHSSHLNFTDMRREHARRPRRLWRRVAAAFLLLEALLLLTFTFGFGGKARADERIKGELNVFTDGGYARLVFRFDQAVPASVREGFPITVITFGKPVSVPIERLVPAARDYISAARIDPDGTAIRIALTGKVKVHTIPAAERLFVDLLPETWTGVMPGLPEDVIAELARRAQEADRLLKRKRIEDSERKPPSIRVRVASQPSFIRYVFELPDGVNVVPERRDGRYVLSFDRPIKLDLADAVASLPPTLKSIDAAADIDSVTVSFVLNGTPVIRSFVEDRSISVDVGLDGAPRPNAAADASEGAAAPASLPGIAAPETVPAAPAQDQAKAAADAPVTPQNPPAASPSEKGAQESAAAKAAPLPQAAPEEPKPAPAPPKPTAPAERKSEAMPAVSPKVAAAPAPAASKVKPPAHDDGIAPDANAPVKAELHKSGESIRIEFPFAVPTPAAVFRRANILWLVFDSKAAIDLAAIRREAAETIREAHFSRSNDGADIVRLKLARPRLTGALTDGPAWIVDIGESVVAPTKQLSIARSLMAQNRASIAIPFDHPGSVHRFPDPAAGDSLMVITGLGPARGFIKEQNFVELRALPSTQGVVLQPLADDLTAETLPDRIIISRPVGLSLSPTAIGQQQLASSFKATSFDPQLWGFDRSANFNRRQSELINAAAMAPPHKRRAARLNLARFYLARDMSAEALAVLDVTLADERGADDVTGTVLKAIANVMFDRPEDALKALSSPQIGNQLDAPIWRAIAYARLGKWTEAHDRFKDTDSALGALPLELQRMALRYALRAAIEVRDFANADKVLNEIQTLGVPDTEAPAVAVLVGRLSEGMGRNQDALVNYRAAAASNDRASAAAGHLHEVLLRYALGDMPRKEVINQLETLTTIWRGDETEVEGLKMLAHLYTEEGRYRDAFHVMRTAMVAHPNSDLTRKIQDESAASFEALFLGGKSDALPPIEALSLFYDYRELTPIGHRGDEMIRKLADRLVAVDLLDQAAELLQHQIDHRLQGAARAQVATRLATIYLMNRKADRALAALRATRTDGLSNELRDQRLLLEARALSETGRHDLALEVIANLQGPQALRLRADILWAGHHWRKAAEAIELLYGERWKQFSPLTDSERLDILRAAIGYSLADEAIGLGRLREKYAAKMADSPDRHAFEVVSSPIGTGSSEFKDVARTVSGIDTLNAFLQDMRQRYPDKPTPAEGEGAAAAPAKPMPNAAATAPADKAANAKAPAATPRPPERGKPDPQPTGSIPGPHGWISRSPGPQPLTR